MKCMMSDQNPHPGDTRHSQISECCPTPPPSGLTLIGALGRERNPGNLKESLNRDNSRKTGQIISR